MISTILLLAQQAPGATPPAGTPSQSSFMPMILMYVCFFVIIYFLMFRPNQKRQKDHQKLLANLRTGDKVVTNSGIHGLVANVKDSTLLLKIADNVKIEVEKSAISSVARQAEPSKSTT
jgi:preprotein translocase subunit YajC